MQEETSPLHNNSTWIFIWLYKNGDQILCYKSCSASERQNGSSGRNLRKFWSSVGHPCLVDVYNFMCSRSVKHLFQAIITIEVKCIW